MSIGNTGTDRWVGSESGRSIGEWAARVVLAVDRVGTPCYVSAWKPVAVAVARFASIEASLPLKLWLSFKTHPLVPLAAKWLASGRGVEVVSESELLAIRALGATADQILVNGVAKQRWLHRHRIHRLRVHFDSLNELEALLPTALDSQWRVGIRCHVPGECDAREPRFSGQFGLSRPAVPGVDSPRRSRTAARDQPDAGRTWPEVRGGAILGTTCRSGVAVSVSCALASGWAAS